MSSKICLSLYYLFYSFNFSQDTVSTSQPYYKSKLPSENLNWLVAEINKLHDAEHRTDLQFIEPKEFIYHHFPQMENFFKSLSRTVSKYYSSLFNWKVCTRSRLVGLGNVKRPRSSHSR